MNPSDCYMNYKNTDWAGSAAKVATYNLIERDGTHCSYELGRYIMGASVYGYIYNEYKEQLKGGTQIDFCEILKTATITVGVEEWKGEFNDSLWDITRETLHNTINTPWVITNSNYVTDPADAMVEKVVNATYGDFTEEGIVATINSLADGFTVTASDVNISGNTATVRFIYGYTPKTVTITK